MRGAFHSFFRSLIPSVHQEKRSNILYLFLKDLHKRTTYGSRALEEERGSNMQAHARHRGWQDVLRTLSATYLLPKYYMSKIFTYIDPQVNHPNVSPMFRGPTVATVTLLPSQCVTPSPPSSQRIANGKAQG